MTTAIAATLGDLATGALATALLVGSIAGTLELRAAHRRGLERVRRATR